MKKFGFIALCFFIGLFALFSPSIYSMDEVIDLQNSINTMVKSVCNTSQNHSDLDGSVMIMGITGHGKTTVASCLAGSPLIAQPQEEGGLNVDTSNPLHGLVIGHGTRPGTILPYPT